ncbi:MAG TPA: hypothetical protein DCS93_12655 [Microscillaceae bacterium]|nr:hypothetical protein [Microscillaceae bacterium]
MKVIKTLIFLLFVSVGCFGQGEWTRMADFAGYGRKYVIGFSINGKVYIGTGARISAFTSTQLAYTEVWRYDPISDTWTQMADLPGVARLLAVAFSLGDKGYVGMGFTFRFTSALKDFWEYNSSLNTWTQKLDFPGVARGNGVGITIGEKGYIGLGSDNLGNKLSDFWEYDPSKDQWSKKADFGGGERNDAICFAINDRGYVGYGSNETNSPIQDFWEYNPASDQWVQKTHSLLVRGHSIHGTSTNKTGYLLKDGRVYAYDPRQDQWSRVADVFSKGYNGGAFVGTGSKIVLCFGYNNEETQDGKLYPKEVWQLNLNFIPALTTLIATTISTSRIDLSWNDEAISEEKYEIYRSTTSSSGFTKVAEVGANTTAYQDQGLTKDVTYYYKIKAVNVTEGFESDFSNETNATTSESALVAPVSPLSPSATALSISSIRVNWVDNSNNEVTFEVYRSTQLTSGFAKVGETLTNVTTFTDSGLNNGTTYYYKILAKNNVGSSSFSPTTSATTLVDVPPLPAKPLNLTAQVTTSNHIQLSWQDQANNETGFELYRSVNNNSSFTKLLDFTANVIGYTDQSVIEGNTYYYQVRAINSGGNSDFSNEASASIPFSSNIVLQAFGNTSNTIRLSWTTTNTSVDGYKIERTDDENKGYAEVADVSRNSLEYIDQNLESGKTYFYRIRSFKGSSFSQYSNRIGANTLVTGINETLSQQIKVLNNPNVTGVFQIKTERLNNQNWQVELRDEQMKVLPQNLVLKSNTGYQIDLRRKPSGVYFLIFDTFNGKVIKRLIKL